MLCISTQAFERNSAGNYADAKYLGLTAIILSMICLMWILAWGVILTAVNVNGPCAYVAGICNETND